ncbi:MAG: hypothetical protein WCL22_00130 [bacterium]
MAEDSSKPRPPDDDRNLVVVDDDFIHADAEDKLWLFWQRNQTVIIRGTTAVVVGLIGFLAFHFWQIARQESLGESYIACQDDNARRAFAAENKGEVLAGVALLEVADNLRKNNKLTEAARAYDEAVLSFKNAEAPALKALGTRAKLYAALTKVDLGQAGAEAGLVVVADDPTAPDTLRGYAMIVLANNALTKGDNASAAKWINLMDKRLRPSNVWAADKNWLVRSEPGLLIPIAAPNPETPASP